MTDTLLRPAAESSRRTGVPTLTWKSPTPVRTPFPLPSSGFGRVFPSQSDDATDTLLPAAVAYPNRGWRKNPSFPIDVRASHTSRVEPSPSSASFLDVGSIPASHAIRPSRTTFRHPLTFHRGLTDKDGWPPGSRRHLLRPFPLCPISTRPTPFYRTEPNHSPRTGANAVYCAISDPFASHLVGGGRPSRHP